MAIHPDDSMGHRYGLLVLSPSFETRLTDTLQTLQGVVTNFSGLMGMRWLLGVFEAGLFPGVNYYLSW